MHCVADKSGMATRRIIPVSSSERQIGLEACAGTNQLVSTALNDSLSTLEQEAAIIDRLFGGEIAAIFERHEIGSKQHIRR